MISLSTNWVKYEFDQVFKVLSSKKHQINKSNYLETGKIPVINQGKKRIVGYTNELSKKYVNTKGVIVFGDHTLNFKYIDFDFVVGADGTKVFELIDSENFNLKFLFYQFLSRQYKILGYRRHFKIIKKDDFIIPTLEEQELIVSKIDTLFAKIDKAISLTEESLKQAKNLIPSVLKEVFEKFESEIKQQKLKDVCELITDGAHYSPKTVDQGYPYVTVRDVSWNGDIDLVGCANISEEDFEDLKRGNCSPMNGDILYSKDGTVGKIALVNEEKEFVVLSSLAIIRPTSTINPKFLMYSMMSPKFYDFALSSKTGAAIKRIVLKTIKEFEVSIPDLESQLNSIKFLDKFVYYSKQTQSELEEQLAYLKQLKSSILSKAFKGEL